MTIDPAAAAQPVVADDIPVVEPDDDEDESRFLLRARVEIVYVIRNLIRSGALVKVHCGGGPDFLLTSLLEVDADAGRFAFEASGSESVNRRVLDAGRLSFHTAQDKVRIHFRTGRASRGTVGRHDAFLVALPDELLRLQRREYFRVTTPLANPVSCIVPLPEGNGPKSVEARLQDISLGGVGLILGSEGPGLEVRHEYPNCRLMLPDVGNVVTTLEIRHESTLTLLNGKTQRRYGCMFARPSSAAVSLVQRYILKLERARKATE